MACVLHHDNSVAYMLLEDYEKLETKLCQFSKLNVGLCKTAVEKTMRDWDAEVSCFCIRKLSELNWW